MAKNKRLKALVMGAVAMTLSCSMLVGTTFAWFTDSVTSSNNVIKSGNLDVELEYRNSKTTSWTTVDENTNVFQSDLWEPGHTEVVYLKVSNAGSLDFKYKLGVNVASETPSTNVYGDPFELSDYIYFDVVNSATEFTYANRAEAMADTTETTTVAMGYSNASSLEAQTSEYATLIVYMPETTGNVVNHAKNAPVPTINLGINVVATQLEAEEDSFGNDYDKGANVSLPINVSTGEAKNVILETETASVEMPAAVVGSLPADVTSLTLVHSEAKTDATNNALTFETVEILDQNGEIVDLSGNVAGNLTITLPVDTSVFANGETVYVFHDSELMASAVVANGEITYTASHLCEIVVTQIAENEEVRKSLVDVLKEGGTYTLTSDVKLDADETITVFEGVEATVDLNGYSILGVSDDADKNDDGNLTSADNEVMFDVRGTLTVKNGTIAYEHKGDNFGWNGCTEIFYVAFNGTLNVENAKLENFGGSDMAYAIDLVNATNVTLNVTNSHVKSSYIPVRVFNNGSGMNNVTIENTKLDGVSRAFWVHIYSDKDNGNKGVKDDTLNLSIYGNDNVFIASNPDRIIEFGFDDELNFDANGKYIVRNNAQFAKVIELGETTIRLSSGDFIVPSAAQGKTLTVVGNGETNVAVTKVGTGGENCDYGFDGSTVTFENVTITTNSSTYIGYARMSGTYNNCTINGTYTLYGNSTFNNCTFNVSGDVYNIWTWGAPNVTFNNCTFNSDGKAILLYGTVDTNLTVNRCVFNDKGGLADLKAAIEIGNDYGTSYTLTVTNTKVNGYEINDKGINTGTTLWANKNSMGKDKLSVIVDDVKVY
ncbi:MAG: hypothetical protein IJB34_05915 [Clostridia bacterium]|nr:hypothetical protein [Clostridia bacterium]